MSAAAYSRKTLILFFVFISIASQSQICSKTQLPANLQNGLVAFYPFCVNANDASGNGNEISVKKKNIIFIKK